MLYETYLYQLGNRGMYIMLIDNGIPFVDTLIAIVIVSNYVE